MIKTFASAALALMLALAPAAAFAQDKGGKEENPDATQFKAEDVAAAPVVGLPPVDFDLTHDLDNILYLDLSNGQRVDASVVAYSLPSATYWFTIVTRAGAGVTPFQTMLSSVAPPKPTSRFSRIRPTKRDTNSSCVMVG